MDNTLYLVVKYTIAIKAPKKTDDSKIVTVSDNTKARNRKKVSNLKGTESGMASGMKKGANAGGQPEH